MRDAVLQIVFNVLMGASLAYVITEHPRYRAWAWIVYAGVYALVLTLALVRHVHRPR